MKLLWCDSAIQPRLGPLDARVIFPLFLWFLHWAYWTLAIALAAVGLLVLLDKLGLPVNVAARQLRTTILGRRRPVQDPVVFRRRCRW
jgi:hypothetical protein